MDKNRTGLNITIVLLVTFILVFPKGGIKISEIPITWGILILLIVGNISIVQKLMKFNYCFNKERFLILAGWLPFQTLCLVSIVENGYKNLGMLLSFLFNLYFVPWVMLGGFGSRFNKIDVRKFFKFIKIGIRIITLYGIFLFFYKIIYGDFIEIPYLTVNYDDIGKLEWGKMNSRMDYSKLMSTYNTGNIYGVCLLMLLPLYSFLEKRKIFQYILKISLILSLTRTVWIGLILYEIFSCFFIKKFKIYNLINIVIVLATVIFSIVYTTYYIGFDASFLFDKDLGGRAWQTEINFNITPDAEFSGFPEIIYLGMIMNFGIIGLILYFFAILVPLALYRKKCFRGENTEFKRCVLTGYIIYLIVSGSDGVMLYIPTMIIFWFLLLLLTSDDEVLRHKLKL